MYNSAMYKKIAAAALSACALLGVTLAGCSKINSYNSMFSSMGTFATLVCAGGFDKPAFDEASGEVYALLTQSENSLSVKKDGSYISAFNAAAAGEKVRLDKTAYTALKKAKEIFEFTGGYYNPAVYYSLAAYGFSDGSYMTEGFTLPEIEEDTLTAYATLASSFGDIIFEEDGENYFATKPETTVQVGESILTLKIDLGGIGKGICADMTGDIFAAHGIVNGYFNFGSSSICFKSYQGSKSGEYKLNARDPRSETGEGYMTMQVKNVMLSTSGDYEQYFLSNGVRYCHIIDPFTSKPIQTGVASVTILGGTAAENDALTTALSVMGEERAVAFINQNLTAKKVIMLIIEGSGGKVITNCPDEVTILNSSYTLANTVKDGKIVL